MKKVEPDLSGLHAISEVRSTARLIAERFAQDRLNALTDGECFMFDQEWKYQFDGLKDLVARRHADRFGEIKKSAHASIREDIAAEAGFLLGLAIGKRCQGM